MRLEFDAAPAPRFKHAFEIGAARKTAAVNYCSVPQRSRDFARERSANRRRRLLCSAPDGWLGATNGAAGILRWRRTCLRQH